MKKTIAVVLLADFADWEVARLAPALRAGVMPGREGAYDVIYLGTGREARAFVGRPVRRARRRFVGSAGRVRGVDPRGEAWRGGTPRRSGGRAPRGGGAAGAVFPVGAICNATLFLAAHGF